jgi:signal transduction histidine kinase
VPADKASEFAGVRSLLRDLVALSDLTAAWLERAAGERGPGTDAVANGFADALVGLLAVDFAFVRLFDPAGAAPVDATRGTARAELAQWLERRAPAGARLRRKERIEDAGDCRGLIVPIGFDGDAGILAVASRRADFPTPTDELLLSLAANQGATAFQTARLIHERRRVEQALRVARDELEHRVAERTEELAHGREQLVASRARLVTAADEARRRVVRDLHDGAQQRLVHTIVTLKMAQRAFELADGRALALLDEAVEHAERSNAELRELAHGILPAALTNGGLPAALDTLVARLAVPVQIDVPDRRFPGEMEASSYFVVAEAITNVVKHSQAASAGVKVEVDGATLRIEISDDGVGGADPGGPGLVGINDRVTALGGQVAIDSPAGGGTRLTATLPLPAE